MTGKISEEELQRIIRETGPRPGGTGIPPSELIKRVLDVVTNLLFIENLDDLLEETARTMREIFPIERVVIWLADENMDRHARVVQGFTEEQKSEIRSMIYRHDEIQETKKHVKWLSKLSWFMPAEIQLAKGFDEREKVYLNNIDQMTKPRNNPDDWHPLDYLDVCLFSRDRKYIGALEIESTTDGKIPSIETIKAMEVFASICSVAIELATLRDKELAIADAAESRAGQISRVLSFSKDVLSLEDPKSVLSSVLRILRDLFGFQSNSIILLDDKESCYKYVTMMGYSEEEIAYAKTLRIPPDALKFDLKTEFMIGRNAYYMPAEELPESRLIWEIYTPGSFEKLRQMKAELRANEGAWHKLDNLMFVINDRQDRVIGVIYVDRPIDNLVPKADAIDSIGIFTSLVSIAIENARNYDETIKAKEEIELLNGLLFRDVSVMNSSMKEYLELAMDSRLPKEQRLRYITSTIEKLDAMVELIQRVRRLSQIQTLDYSSLVRVDIASVLRNQVGKAVGKMPNKRIKVLFKDLPEDAFVLANDMIGELFNDVLSYSLKNNFTEQPEILLSIDRLSDEFNNRKFWDVTVSDNGTGIPDDKKHRLFDIDPRISDEVMTDISLVAVRSIAGMFGGRVWVDDRYFGDPAGGSIFHILLPAG